MTSITQSLFRSRQFLSYWLQAVDAHSLHGPFSYNFYQEVVKAPKNDLLKPLQKLRDHLCEEGNTLEVLDLGAGKDRKTTRTIGQIARTSHNPKVARMLFNLVRFTGANHILELGTNLGLTTQHLAVAAPEGRVLTIEACPQLGNEAQKYFQWLGLSHIELIRGNIDHQLLPVLKDLGQLDLLFLDANHRYQATLTYFDTSLKFIHKRSVMIIDDIHWSSQMTKAWNEIIQNQRVTLSLDLFQAGVVFFDPELKKEHLLLEF